MIWLGTLGALLERGETIGVASLCEEGEKEGSTSVGGVMGWKGGWEKFGFRVEELIGTFNF